MTGWSVEYRRVGVLADVRGRTQVPRDLGNRESVDRNRVNDRSQTTDTGPSTGDKETQKCRYLREGLGSGTGRMFET